MLRDLINLSSVPLLDIKYLLDAAEKDVRQFLQDSKFDDRTINICVDGRGSGRYARLFEEQHPLLFDEKYRWHTIVLQQISDIRHFLKSDDIPADEWVSHGYMLGYLQFLAYGPENFKAVISNEMSKRSEGRPRKRKDMRNKGIAAVLSRADVDLWGFGMKAFREYVGQDRKVPALDGHIWISAIEDASGKITEYAFQYRPSDERESSEDSGTTGAIRTAISRLKKTK